jgi:PhoD-like phosphatase
VGVALVLGPLLRRVVGNRATIWVETTEPTTVEVSAGDAGGAARTFTAFGRYYALVVVDGLPVGGATPYRVLLGGEQVWPPADYRFPAPTIRTRAAGAPVRLVFGSCREATPQVTKGIPPDALDAYAARLAASGSDWPDVLVLLGDQVYADVPSPPTRRWLGRRRRHSHPEAPPDQVADFAEYARLYRESWTDPQIRWLLSTVPSVMIFDDHEVIDDWNTSASWRADAVRQPWWSERISAALASYWVYQHLGNLHPDELGTDPTYPAVTSAADATGVLREFGAAADRDRAGYRWSYALDIGDTRLVVLDNRCGRQLEPGRRAMLAPQQWDWFARTVASGGYRHLAVGCSLPWLLPYGVHHLEAATSSLAESRYRPVAAIAERLRQAADLEHWPAFGASFEAMAALLSQLDPGVASISVLSGDVHHSYLAAPDLDGPPIYQITCSPIHNRVPAFMRQLFRVTWGPRSARVGRLLSRMFGVRPLELRWTKLAGPYFGNAVGTVVHNGQHAYVAIEATDTDATLVRVMQAQLSP